jgi:hypothetical protein
MYTLHKRITTSLSYQFNLIKINVIFKIIEYHVSDRYTIYFISFLDVYIYIHIYIYMYLINIFEN